MHQLTHKETNWQATKQPLILACDNWKDPRNVGMAFRLADAFGIQEIWLGGDMPTPPNKKITKTARSTDKWVHYKAVPNLATALEQAKSEGHTLWGIEITSESLPLEKAKENGLPQSLIIVVGAESKGISPEVLECIDACFHIPMFGKNTSLNVATALGIALYSISQMKLVGIKKTKNNS